MSSIDSLDVMSTSTNASRKSFSEGNRYRWETQWLQQNRNVSGIVASDEAEFPTAVSARLSPETLHTLVRETEVCAPLIPSVNSPTAEAADSANREHYYGGLSLKAVVGNALPLVAVPTEPVPLRTMGGENKVIEQQALALYSKSQPQSFALWRNEEDVTVTLRLHEPERQAESVLNIMRQWLEEGGLRLLKMIVNGRPYWARASEKDSGF